MNKIINESVSFSVYDDLRRQRKRHFRSLSLDLGDTVSTQM